MVFAKKLKMMTLMGSVHILYIRKYTNEFVAWFLKNVMFLQMDLMMISCSISGPRFLLADKAANSSRFLTALRIKITYYDYYLFLS
jgi:hypothetical protein